MLRPVGLALFCTAIASLCPASEGEPSFAEDIAPILYRSCVSCHHDEGIGPFPLIEYKDAARRSRQIAEVVEERYMPPWKPIPGHGPRMKGERRLSDAEIDLIVRWHDAGAPAGDFAALPQLPDLTSGWELGQPDLILELPEAYELKAEGADVFRNFVIPVPLGRKRYVRAFEFLPQTKLAVHHASFALTTGVAERLRDEADPEPGYESLDLGDSINPSGHIIGWTPGQVPYQVYPGTAWELDPGVDLLMQLHLLPTGKVESVKPRIGLYFTDDPPTRASYVALLREYDIDIPAGESNYEVEERVEVPVDVEALGLFPHAHYLGKDFRVFVELPNGETRWLLRIDDWDLNWQSDYSFEEPLPIPAGAELVMQLSYDNSSDNFRNPSVPPRRVGAGWGSFDEMGEVAIQLLLKDVDDLPRLEEALARYDTQRADTEIQGWYNLAVALFDQGRIAEAIEAYEECLYLDPGHAKALNNLGAIYEERGRMELSRSFYEKAIHANANQEDAYMNLARVQARDNLDAECIATLQRLLLANPLHKEGRRMLGLSYLKVGDARLAVQGLEEGMRWHGKDPVYILDLADAYAMGGSVEKAFAAVGDALALDSDFVDGHLMLMYLGYQSGELGFARRKMDYLLSLDASVRPSVDRLASSVLFPDGIIDLAMGLADVGSKGAADVLLEQAEAFARAQGNGGDAERINETRRRIGQ
ncbi:tetratricopeptide repeat protein [Pelagicoccus sp. NFK12]|uniref:Tetratricopeptide repeat protein n=1 Tax=Pelagicoccus enzymogenes TaxID=2773457 RepID=A0A927IFM7_9BACT|nr:tetratricopeptide repeat protein [Pelagicoccus enzymogenes]MBD5777959.1 tetratricopeptide repeat protein [Pelagicoccus enzymogenes]